MKRKRKKGTHLPRVMLLSMSKAELVRLVEALESLVTVAGDLRIVADRLDRATASKTTRGTRKATATNGEQQ